MSQIIIRPVFESDLAEADRIFRFAFGTFIGLPNPMDFAGDADYIHTRFKANPSSGIAAEIEGKLVGTIWGVVWGSVGFFGPLTVDPSAWDKGVGKALVAPMMDWLRNNGVRHAGLFTFSSSAKHLGLYQKFGFAPRFLTAIMSKRAEANDTAYATLSTLDDAEREIISQECRALTHDLYEGLDLTSEMDTVSKLALGESIVIADGNRVEAFAVCHTGAGTEAGSGTCYVKFAGLRPGPEAEEDFATLLRACEAFAATKGLQRVVAGVNTACDEAYRYMLSSGYRSDIIGIAMHAPNEPGYFRPGVYACGDWR